MEEVKKAVQAAVKELFKLDIEPELNRPDEQFGDYTTNLALQLAGKLQQDPQAIAKQLAEKLNGQGPINQAQTAGPGFINLHLTDDFLIKQAFEHQPDKPLQGKVVVTEYSDPNPFKVLHAGHLYTSIVGDAISNLLEAAGGTVHRVNFGGDVGLHVGKTMWAILKDLDGENPGKLAAIPEAERSEWMAKAYVEGTNAYAGNETAKPEIVQLNKRVYQLHDSQDHGSPFAQIYWTCRQWSYDYFDKFYASIGVKFEKYYPESEVAPLGLKTVQEQLEKGVYQQSDGAVIFDGEKYGLHARVFINSEGLPTYEAKDVGLIMTKWQDYHFDKSVVITGNDIVEYMKVVLKSVEQFQPQLVAATTHLTHGIVKLEGGEKMSSRKGNILRAVDVLDAAARANQKSTGKQDEAVEIGAVKYSFLKQRIGADIIYDPEESVSIQGNSGPYLQYAHARARSILNKSPVTGHQSTSDLKLETSERSLVRKLGEYPEVISQAVNELMPHHICTYLYELAQTFNRFYETNRVLDDPRQNQRLKIVRRYADTLKNGLNLLNIHAPDKM
ncbi:MAG: arginine--tRNA ligase [Candidatus Saccharimonadales bacterium]